MIQAIRRSLVYRKPTGSSAYEQDHAVCQEINEIHVEVEYEAICLRCIESAFLCVRLHLIQPNGLVH